MMEFFRFPHTPHLAWLGVGEPRDDKVLTPDETESLLSHNVTVEEKVDGANVGFSVDEEGNLQVQNRGSFLTSGNCPPQFKPIWQWLEPRRDVLCDALFPDLMLFGEWCYAAHTVRYSRLPNWFLGFDVFDRASWGFWSVSRRDELLGRLGLAIVPTIGVGSFDLPRLRALLGQSRLSDFLPKVCTCGSMNTLGALRGCSGLLRERSSCARSSFSRSGSTGANAHSRPIRSFHPRED
jgi:hypothetical protein